MLNKELEISEDFVGSFYCNYDYVRKYDLFKSLNAQVPEYIMLDYNPSHVIQLNDGNILISSYRDNIMGLYDNDFNLIRKITKINNEPFQSDGLAKDNNGNLFIVNDLKKTVDLLDSELRYIRSIHQPYDGYYSDIFAHENRLYACVPALKRIDIITCGLETISEIRLDIVPYQLKILNQVACVLVNYSKIYFYNISKFELISKFDGCGSILAYNDLFYVYQDDGFSLFDPSGNFIGKKSTYYGRTKQICADISVINRKLIICLDQKICKIYLK
jgi:hypothetical protein